MNRPMFLYECIDCTVVFAVEEAFEDQSIITCPICNDGVGIMDRGSGDFILTREPDGDGE